MSLCESNLLTECRSIWVHVCWIHHFRYFRYHEFGESRRNHALSCLSCRSACKWLPCSSTRNTHRHHLQAAFWQWRHYITSLDEWSKGEVLPCAVVELALAWKSQRIMYRHEGAAYISRQKHPVNPTAITLKSECFVSIELHHFSLIVSSDDPPLR